MDTPDGAAAASQPSSPDPALPVPVADVAATPKPEPVNSSEAEEGPVSTPNPPSAVAASSATPPQSFLVGLGIDATAGQAFWKPDGHPRRITVLAARPPAPDERNKKLPESHGNAPITVLAVLNVLDGGVEKRWDVTSKRCIEALDAVLTHVPIDLVVKTTGEKTDTQFTVRLAPAASSAKPAKPAAPGAPCDAPGCVHPDGIGHAGRHKGAKTAPTLEQTSPAA